MAFIKNCDFKFKCPRKWEQLAETDDAGIRFCAACERKVYWCETAEELRNHAGGGRCVAVKLQEVFNVHEVDDTRTDGVVGMVEATYNPHSPRK